MVTLVSCPTCRTSNLQFGKRPTWAFGQRRLRRPHLDLGNQNLKSSHMKKPAVSRNQLLPSRLLPCFITFHLLFPCFQQVSPPNPSTQRAPSSTSWPCLGTPNAAPPRHDAPPRGDGHGRGIAEESHGSNDYSLSYWC